MWNVAGVFGKRGGKFKGGKEGEGGGGALLRFYRCFNFIRRMNAFSLVNLSYFLLFVFRFDFA